MHYNEVYFSQQSEFGDSPDSSKIHIPCSKILKLFFRCIITFFRGVIWKRFKSINAKYTVYVSYGSKVWSLFVKTI